MVADLKRLGQMARATTPFDDPKANADLSSLKAKNDHIPARFAPAATAPKSQPRHAVWTDPTGLAQRTV